MYQKHLSVITHLSSGRAVLEEWIRPQTSILEVPGSNPSLVVVPLGKVL